MTDREKGILILRCCVCSRSPDPLDPIAPCTKEECLMYDQKTDDFEMAMQIFKDNPDIDRCQLARDLGAKLTDIFPRLRMKE